VALSIIEYQFREYEISTDPKRVDSGVVHGFLANHAYWSMGRARETIEVSIRHSAVVCGAYEPSGNLVAFARAVTDLATFAWICDVFVLPDHRGQGVGKTVARTIVQHPALKNLQRQILATSDAHGVYSEVGFVPLQQPENWMERPGTS
jgi:GNAT superfamily N-acetyltransferase